MTVKIQGASELLSILGLIIPLSNIPPLDGILI